MGLLAAATLALGACDGLGGTAGGADDLPEAVPADVTFQDPPEDAMAAPEFSGRLLDDTAIEGADLWGERPVVLVFTASWCERCADVHREMADVVDEYDGAVTLLGLVREEDADDAEDYAADLGLGYPVAAVDEATWLNYAAEEPPLVLLISHEGRVLRGWPGGVDAELLAEHVDDLIEDEAIEDGPGDDADDGADNDTGEGDADEAGEAGDGQDGDE